MSIGTSQIKNYPQWTEVKSYFELNMPCDEIISWLLSNIILNIVYSICAIYHADLDLQTLMQNQSNAAWQTCIIK